MALARGGADAGVIGAGVLAAQESSACGILRPGDDDEGAE